MVFFSKNKRTAMQRLRNLQAIDSYYKRYKTVKLARKQIPHINNWKTWEFR